MVAQVVKAAAGGAGGAGGNRCVGVEPAGLALPRQRDSDVNNFSSMSEAYGSSVLLGKSWGKV